MKVAICDDDKEQALSLQKKVDRIPGVSSTECFFAHSSLKFILDEGYDVILMDIDWGENKTGIDIAAELFEEGQSSKVIFVTSYTEKYVEQVFLQNTNVVGFLVKPVKEEKLQALFIRINDQQKEKVERKLILRENGRQIVIAFSEIFCIESKDHYMEVITMNGTHRIPGTLAAMEKELPAEFIRCHKGFIINMNHIYSFTNSFAVLKNRMEIPIGRHYSADVKRKYIQFIADQI